MAISSSRARRFSLTLAALLSLSFLSGCCSMMQADSAARASNLQIAHVSLIDKYTVSGATHPTALPAGFEDDVASRMKKFDDAVAFAQKCHLREQIFENDRKLFQADVALLRQQFFYSPAGARNAKKIVERNYAAS